MTQLQVPELPGYRDVTPISSGSTSLVFRAVQTRLSRTVAIKVLLVDDDTTSRAQYERELETTVLLSSQPHIVGIIDTGTTAAGNPYIVMEYCPGGSYAQILRQRGPLPLEEVVDVGTKIAEALQAAHDVGVLHRDVKPSNILRSAFGPALADFGIARAPHQLHGTVSMDRMTPYHASPEALRKDNQSPASDLYSLASTMWHLLAGRPPFSDPARPIQDLDDLRQRVFTEPAPPVPRPDVPDWLQRELARALAKEPGQRHPSAHTFAEILRYHAYRTRDEELSGWPSRSPDPSSAAVPPVPVPPASGPPASGPPVPGPPGGWPAGPPVAPRSAFRWPQAAPTRRSEFTVEPERPPLDPAALEAAAASTVTWSGTPAEPATPATPGPQPPASPQPPATLRPPTESTPPAAPGPDQPPAATGLDQPRLAPAAEARPAALTRPAEVHPGVPAVPPGPPAAPPTTTPPSGVPPTGVPPVRGSALSGPAPLTQAVPPPGPPAAYHQPPPARGRPGTPPTGAPPAPPAGAPPAPPTGAPPIAPRRPAEPRRQPVMPWPDEATGRGRRHNWLLVGTAAVTVLVLAVVIGLLITMHGSTPRQTTTGPLSTSPAPASTGTLQPTASGAPTGVKLVDNRTSVTLSWTDPTAGTVTFAVLGGIRGTEPRLLKTLNPGTTTLTLQGLNTADDYCYIVMAIYSTQVYARSPQVCTNRF